MDVSTRIGRPRTEVAAFACDPNDVTAWYQNIKGIEWQTARPATQGSRIRFAAEFLGCRLVYAYEVVDLVPGERLVMATTDGPFAMETTYEWSDAAGGAARMTLRNRGRPAGSRRSSPP